MSVEARQSTEQTSTRQCVESIVTNGLGFRFEPFIITPEHVRTLQVKHTSIGLQNHLGELEVRGRQVDDETRLSVGIMGSLFKKCRDGISELGSLDVDSLANIVDNLCAVERVVNDFLPSDPESIPEYPETETHQIGEQQVIRFRIRDLFD